MRIAEAFRHLPLSFEANRGQVDAQVDFLARGSGYTLFLTPREAVLLLHSRGAPLDGREQRAVSAAVLRIQLSGANAQPQVAALDELPGKVNYFIGNDPSRWRTNIPTYAKVAYQDVYEGVDLVYYGTQGRLEYDFIIQPGTDPGGIALAFQGAERLEVDGRGDLVLQTAVGPVRQPKPVIYQEVGGARREIAGGYVLRGPQQVGFQVAAYDVSRPLVIDPTLFYSTYLGGSNVDQGLAIAVDDAGSAYVTGSTASFDDFPNTNPFAAVPVGDNASAFVTKLTPLGDGIVYSTFFGGAGTDEGRGIAVDIERHVYVTGFTEASDFPATPGAVDETFNGVSDAFVTKLHPSGAVLVYSTYLGGSGQDLGNGIAVDDFGNAYVTGFTESADFPAGPGFSTMFNGGGDAFVTKLDPAGAILLYSTYLGGGSVDQGLGIAVDDAGSAYVTGSTTSPDFPNPAGAPVPIGDNAFVTKMDPTGSGLIYSTILGGSGDDAGSSIAVDTAFSAYVTGRTDSADFPTTLGAFDPECGNDGNVATCDGGTDAFVTKLDPVSIGGAAALVYSTYLGGRGDDVGFGLALDTMGRAHVTGTTGSPDFPITFGPFGPSGGGDAFVTKLNPAGAGPADLIYSTSLGGSGSDEGRGIAVDTAGEAYVTGFTQSSNFPTSPGAFDTTFNGLTDAFVAKVVGVAADLSVTKTDSPDPVMVGQDLTYTITVKNNGPDTATAVTLTDDLPDEAGFVPVGTSPECVYNPANHTVTCTLGILVAGSTATVTIVVRAVQGGTITNTATVAGNEPDPNTANNTAIQRTKVTGPPNPPEPPACDVMKKPPEAKKPPICP